MSRSIVSRHQKHLINQMLRVNHAGELGANFIYKGQLRVLKNKDTRIVVEHMWDQEKHHLAKFNEIMTSSRVRPSILLPIWAQAGYMLGVGCSLLGERSAMVLTEAVETVIGNHYNDQIRELIQIDDPEVVKLVKVLKEFRDDELEHLNTAVEFDSKSAPLYSLMSFVIQNGCKAAIKVAKIF